MKILVVESDFFRVVAEVAQFERDFCNYSGFFDIFSSLHFSFRELYVQCKRSPTKKALGTFTVFALANSAITFSYSVKLVV